MFVPHRAFRWLTSATAAQGPPIVTPEGVVLWGVHDAYCRLPDGGRIARTVLVTQDGVSCIDWREGGPQDRLASRWRFPPWRRWKQTEFRLPKTMALVSRVSRSLGSRGRRCRGGGQPIRRLAKPDLR